jgi:hypothetical protein
VTPITDAGGYYTSGNVEGALQEIGAGTAGSFLTTTDATDDVTTVAASGTSHTIEDPTANIQDITLTGNCAFTMPTPVDGKAFTVRLRQDATGSRTATWDASVAWVGGSAPTLQTAANALDLIAFLSDGVGWIGIHSGGGSSVGALDDLSDVTITTPAVGDMLRYNGSGWVNSALRWEPVVTDPGTGPEIVFTSGDIVMTWADYS